MFLEMMEHRPSLMLDREGRCEPKGLGINAPAPMRLKNNINWIVSNRALAKKGVAGKE